MAASKLFKKFRSLSMGSEDAAALYCQPCEGDNKQLSAYGYCQTCAEHLCEECYKIHTKPAPLRSHVLLDRSKMPQSQSHRPSQSKEIEIELETCHVHDSEAINYYCENHNIFGCCQCEDIHKNCKTVNVNEVTIGFQSSEEYKNMLKRIENVKSNCIDVNKTVKDNLEIIQKSREAVRKEVEACRKQINDKLDRWENDLYVENDRLHDTQYANATSTLGDSNDILQKALQLEENWKKQQAAGNNTRLYIQVKKDGRTLNKFDTKSEYVKTDARFVQRYQFRASTDIFNTRCLRIGQILPKNDTSNNLMSCGHISDKTVKPSIIKGILKK